MLVVGADVGAHAQDGGDRESAPGESGEGGESHPAADTPQGVSTLASVGNI